MTRVRLLAMLGPLVLLAGPASAQDRWVPPLGGRLEVGRAFDAPAQRWAPGHRGVDLVTVPDAEVRAAGAGVVTFAGVLAGRGVVTVTHGALRTTYEPVRPTAQVGQRVGAGEVIGRLAHGHAQTGPAHAVLHWGLRRGDTYLDPLRLLRLGPPRLLPHWRSATGFPESAGWPAPGPGAPRAVPIRSSPARLADAARSPPASSAGGSPIRGGAVVAAMAVVTAAAAVRRRGPP